MVFTLSMHKIKHLCFAVRMYVNEFGVCMHFVCRNALEKGTFTTNIPMEGIRTSNELRTSARISIVLPNHYHLFGSLTFDVYSRLEYYGNTYGNLWYTSGIHRSTNGGLNLQKIPLKRYSIEKNLKIHMKSIENDKHFDSFR